MHTSKYMRISVRCIYQCVAYHLDATHWNYADKKHICERPDERTFTHRFQLKYSSKTTVPAEKKKPDELSNMHHVPLPIQWWSNNSVQTKHAPAKARRTPPHMPLLYHLCMARQTWTVPKISIPLVHGTTFSMCWCVCANKKRTCEQWWAPSHVIHIYRNQRQNTQYSTDVISTAKHSVLNRHWYQQQNTQYSPDVILTATLSTQQTLISTAKHSVLNRRDINGKTLNTQQTCYQPIQWQKAYLREARAVMSSPTRATPRISGRATTLGGLRRMGRSSAHKVRYLCVTKLFVRFSVRFEVVWCGVRRMGRSPAHKVR